MARVHSKNMVVLLDDKDISQYCDNSEHKKNPDIHDVTGYGVNSHGKAGGLLDGAGKLSGTYDSTASTGPRAVINPLVGQTVEFTRRPEGTGVGKPQDTVNVVVGEYAETAPVADMIKWSVSLEYSGDVDSAAQIA